MQASSSRCASNSPIMGEPYSLVPVDAAATFRIRQLGDAVELLDSSGTPFRRPTTPKHGRSPWAQYAHMVRYRNALELHDGDMSWS